MRFESPWALLILLLIPAAVYWRNRNGSAALTFSSTIHAAQAGVSLRQRFMAAPLALRVLALVFLALALARPQQGRERVHDVSKGVAIEMVADRSGSMGAPMDFGHEQINRLEVVKRVFNEFINGNGKSLRGRPDDLAGLIAFARYPETLCPLTLAHGALPQFLQRVDVAKRREEDGTAIGDALALAAARLKTAEEELAHQSKGTKKEYAIKSKIIILLTDGQHNYGKRSPLEAAALAAEWGIKIYTVGVGGGDNQSFVQTPFGQVPMAAAAPLDEDTLRAIASKTGGIYRRADDADSLRDFYKEIDQLEKTEIESVKYLDYREWFPLFALLTLLCVIAEIVLSGTLLRRVP